jgi:uncharacterized membrane-anchored protein
MLAKEGHLQNRSRIEVSACVTLRTMKPIIAAILAGCALVTIGFPSLAEDESAAAREDSDSSAFRKQLSELHWVHGPQRVQLFGNSTLDVPAEYLFLEPADTAKLETLTHNVGGGTQYFLAPKDLHWEVFFSFRDDGYVKDDEKIDAAALLKTIEDSTEAANKVRRERGWDEMQVVGWQTPPHYDTQSNRLEWAVEGKDLKSSSVVVNFNTRLLGRGGVMSAVLITSPDGLSASIADLKSTLAGFEYSPGQRYAEYKPGDKIAKYGLAALVTGGAAAIAVKTGFWKVIVAAAVAGWKFVAAAAVALFGGIARRFKRKTV